MEKDEIGEFLRKLKMNNPEPISNQWDNVIMPESTYLIMGDKRMGKSALAYWLLETFGKKYDLLQVVVGLPRAKQSLLPPEFVVKDTPDECMTLENAIIFIDEAGIQLPIEDVRAREYVVNFLSLPGHRNQILLLTFHFPKLVLIRYLPFFDAFLLKRPPYLLEFAGKRQNDMFTQMMLKAEERFKELPSLEDIKRHTYVVAPRLRWQGMLENPLSSFWTADLSKVWAGTTIKVEPKPSQPALLGEDEEVPEAFKIEAEYEHEEIVGFKVADPKGDVIRNRASLLAAIQEQFPDVPLELLENAKITYFQHHAAVGLYY